MAGPEESLRIDTVKGPVSAMYARPPAPFATIVVAHGAGAGMDHPFIAGFARACVDEGLAALRFNFHYIESGRRSPDTEAVLRDAWRAAFERTSLFAPMSEHELPNEQRLDAGGMEARVGSTSFIAALDEPERKRVLERARAIAGEGTVTVPYRAEVQMWRRS